MQVYIGYDSREHAAFSVAAKTARQFGCHVQPLYEDRLRRSGMLTRTTDTRGKTWDFNSSAPQATEFAISRFFVPLLAHSGWAMFVDCDVLFLEDPVQLMALVDPSKAVYCVQHTEFKTVQAAVTSKVNDSGQGFKMDGQLQTLYRRKLWSSVMLYNCDHPANSRLNLTMLNSWPGRDLHAFGWLHDSEIGALPPEANWLVGLQEKPERPIIAHYTLGTPNMPGLESSAHADLWFNCAEQP